MEGINQNDNLSELINLIENQNLDDEISVLIEDANELQSNDLAIEFTLSFKRENSKIYNFLSKFSTKSATRRVLH